MKKLVPFFLLLFGTSLPSFACDCEYEGGFLTVAPKAELIVMVKVTKYLTFKDLNNEPMPMSMEVEITEVLKGQEKRKTIVIWGDNGVLCRPYLSTFKEGNTYIMALTHPEIYEPEATTEYVISSCGRYWLDVQLADNTVTGDINPQTNSISLKALREHLQLH